MTFLLFLLTLSILVFVHELGHFIAAKRAGIRVLEFGFGLPPRLIGKRIGETTYSLNLLPIGGFVRLFGEDEADLAEEGVVGRSKTRAFFRQPKRVRAAVVLAGALMNFLLGIVLFSGLYSLIGIPTPTDGVAVVEIFQGSPAAEVFQLGDELISVEGTPVSSTSQFQELIEVGRGREVAITLLRNGTATRVVAIPRSDPPIHVSPPRLAWSDEEGRLACSSVSMQEGALGVVIAQKTAMARYPIWQMPLRGAWFGLQVAYNWGLTILSGIGAIFSQLACGSVPKDVGGPVEIAFLVSEVSRSGIIPLLNLVAILSINLGVVNLLPIPALDGGRLLFIGVEAMFGRRISARAERMTHAVGMAILIALMLAITLQDVLRRTGEDSLGALLRRVSSL